MFSTIVDDHTPNSCKKTINTFNTIHVPRLGGFQRPHEHFVKAQTICTVIMNHCIRVDDITPTLRHFRGTGIDPDFRVFQKNKRVTFFLCLRFFDFYALNR